MYRLVFSPNIRCLSYFNGVVGPKVLDIAEFKSIATATVLGFLENTPPDEDGEWTVVLKSSKVLPFLSSGIGRKNRNHEDYVVRKHAGRVGIYLKREFALPPERCEVLVVTKERYLADHQEHEPHGFTDAELADVTHVVVGIRIHAGPDTDRHATAGNFVTRLAGLAGNVERQAKHSVTTICNEAWGINNYWRDFAEVAD